MRLIVEYSWGEEWVGSWTETIPVEYKSAEAFLCDFDELLEKTRTEGKREFKLAGYTFELDKFIEVSWDWVGKKSKKQQFKEYKTLPNIYTVDEWFKRNKQ